MRGDRLLVAIVAAAVALFSGRLAAQVAGVPVRVAFNLGASQVAAGTAAPLRLELRNFQNRETPAPEDVRVRIASPEIGLDVEVVIPRGRSSVPVPVTPGRVGVVRLRATAKGLAPGQAMLLVVPATRAGAARLPGQEPEKVGAAAKKEAAATGIAGKAASAPKHGPAVGPKVWAYGSGAVPHPAAPPPPPPAPTPPAPGLALQLEVQPAHVYPDGKQWRADVLVYVADRQQVPAPAPSDAIVDLGAQEGTITPSQVRIAAGEYSSAGQQVQLVATRDGTDVLRARSPLGNAEARVVYETPRPTRLQVSLSPKSVVNSGRSEVSVSVTLRDDEGRPAVFTDRDLAVQLTSTLGTLSERTTAIPSGRFYADERTLSSAQSGSAVVTADALGMTATDTVEFRFPVLLVALSVVGGVLGAFVRAAKKSFSSGWLKHVAANLVVGAILGVVVYALVLFGAVTAIPKVDINLAAIPTLNELGAFVLGAIGGLLGRGGFDRFLQA